MINNTRDTQDSGADFATAVAAIIILAIVIVGGVFMLRHNAFTAPSVPNTGGTPAQTQTSGGTNASGQSTQ